MEEDGLEGQGLCEGHSHEDHPGNPKEENVIARLKEVRGVEELELLIIRVWPSKDGEREEAGGEPRVQHVLISLHSQISRTRVFLFSLL